MKTVAIVQARMGSSRLPGKVLMDIGGKPMLCHVVERTLMAIKRTVVATTTNPEDDAIVQTCIRRGWAYFRGHPTNVLERYIAAATAFKADKIIRITGDCPLIDPEVIIKVSEALTPHHDYASNLYPRSYPKGLDCEALWMETLLTLRGISYPDELEHVTPAIGRCRDKFKIANVTVNWSVDTKADLENVRKLHEVLR